MQKIINYLKLMRVHKPIGTFLLLWPTLWALWIAGNGHPHYKNVIIFISGVFIMRSAGDVINDFADRNFDAHVARTKDRPLVTGAVSAKEAIILFIVLCLIALLLVWQLNLLTIQLSVVGLLLAIIYPFTKRYTHWPQLVLGAAYSWGIPMAFAAETGRVPMLAWWIYITALIWVLAYDTQYAMADRADDVKIGIKSTAILFGKYDRMMIGGLQILVLISLLILGVWLKLNTLYFISVLIAGGLFVYQQYLIRDRNPTLCLKAFLNNSWVGLVIFLGIVL